MSGPGTLDPSTQPNQPAQQSQLRAALVSLGLIVALGILGYRILENWTFLEAAYMTVITLTTVGFHEVHTLSAGGQVFTILLLISGFGTVAYTAVIMAQTLVEGGLRRVLGKRQMDRRLQRIKGHIILCGFGRVGRMIAEEFRARKVSFVVIEKDPEASGVPADYLAVAGDSTEDEVLEAAHIRDASSLVVAFPSRADAVYVILSARQLNKKIHITARGDAESDERKLKRAGANRVVCPHRTGAQRMAITTLQPNVVDFIKLLSSGRSAEVVLEEYKISARSNLIGKTLREADFRQQFGLMVVGIKHPDQPSLLSPSPEEPIRKGDILVLVGPGQAMQNLEQETEEKGGGAGA